MEEREMHKATCSDCGQECEVPFKPTQGRPVRCKDCFRKNRPSRPRRRFNRQMHKATCAECGKECKVPFKPTQGKPVYCKECFMNKRNSEE